MTTSPLQPFGPDIWTVDGPTVSVIGFHYPTRMAIIRLADGGLFIWSPVALTGEMCPNIDGLGPVRFIIAPNTLHDLFIKEWQAAYPAAKTFAAPGLRNIPIDATLTDAPPPEWAGQVDQVPVRGNRITTEVVFFHAASGTVLFTDLLQHFPRGWFRGWRGIVAHLDRLTAAEPAVPQKFRVAFSDRKTARADVQRILAWPATKVLMAHGAPVLADGLAFLRRAFSWLMK